MKRAVVLGYGRMGSWLVRQLLERDLIVGVYDPLKDLRQITAKAHKLETLEQLQNFSAQILINAASLNNCVAAFTQVLKVLPADCLLADIASIKENIAEFYTRAGRNFVSVHPMFGPTFASLNSLQGQNAIIIKDSCAPGRAFFADIFARLELKTFQMSFAEHDRMMAYSLSVPFFCSLLFADAFESANVPGSTFAKHLQVAQGLLSEDPELLIGVLGSSASRHKLDELQLRAQALVGLIAAADQDPVKQQLQNLKTRLAQ